MDFSSEILRERTIEPNLIFAAVDFEMVAEALIIIIKPSRCVELKTTIPCKI